MDNQISVNADKNAPALSIYVDVNLKVELTMIYFVNVASWINYVSHWDKRERGHEKRLIKRFTLKWLSISEKSKSKMILNTFNLFNLRHGLLLVLCWGISPGHSYSMTYYDCDNPTSIHDYASMQVCDSTPGQWKHNTIPAMLLQRRRVAHLSGYHCQVWRSTFTYMCGVWGHLKTLSPPEILHNYEISTHDCEQMVTRGKFTTTAGKPMRVEVGAVTDMGETDVGSIVVDDDGKLKCQGVTTQVAGIVVKDEVKLHEWRVSVRKVKFAAKDTTVEVVEDQLTLSCPEAERGCRTGQGTYYWGVQTGTQLCPLEFIRMVNVEKTTEGLVYDARDKVLLNITGSVTEAHCPQALYSATNHPNILVSLGPTANPQDYTQLESVELDLEAHVAMRMDAEAFARELKDGQSEQGKGHPVCHIWDLGDYQPGPHHVDGHVYAINRGQVTYTFDCEAKQGSLVELDQCYREVPLTDGLFVDPTTLVKVAHPTPVVCSQRFPLLVKALQGWVSVNPKISTHPYPETELPLNYVSHHTATLGGGLYTESEMEAWKQVLSFPAYHRALTQELALGVCLQRGNCPEGTAIGGTRYDLQPLVANPVPFWDWKTRLNNWFTRNGGYLSAIMMLVYFCHITAMVSGCIMRRVTAIGNCWNYLTTRKKTPPPVENRARFTVQSEEIELERMRSIPWTQATYPLLMSKSTVPESVRN